MALGCAWQMINCFHQMLFGAGMVPLGIAVLSLVAGIPSKPGSYAVHIIGATSPGTQQMTGTQTHSVLASAGLTLVAGQPRSRPWDGEWESSPEHPPDRLHLQAQMPLKFCRNSSHGSWVQPRQSSHQKLDGFWLLLSTWVC